MSIVIFLCIELTVLRKQTVIAIINGKGNLHIIIDEKTILDVPGYTMI